MDWNEAGPLLEEMAREIGGIGLIEDDAGRWAVAWEGGTQSIHESAQDSFVTTFFMEKAEWDESPIEAIHRAYAVWGPEDDEPVEVEGEAEPQ